jgi:hypothetical protein
VLPEKLAGVQQVLDESETAMAGLREKEEQLVSSSSSIVLRGNVGQALSVALVHAMALGCTSNGYAAAAVAAGATKH